MTNTPVSDENGGTWKPNFVPGSSAATILRDWIEIAEKDETVSSIKAVQAFLREQRKTLKLESIDMMELREYAHFVSHNALTEHRGELYRAFETSVHSIMMDSSVVFR